MHEDAQILSNINMGLVVLGRDLTVSRWNKWMEHHSGIPEADIVGKVVLEPYPNLGEPMYRRFIDTVFSFGSYAYFSQRLHRFLFKMRNPHASADVLPDMQQSCTAGPIRGDDNKIVSVYIAVEDVTENVLGEMRLRDNILKLEAALARVKVLEGIIPICMYCKSIRNDNEMWERVDRYITQHSDAEFTHGICPDCFEKQPWLAD